MSVNVGECVPVGKRFWPDGQRGQVHLIRRFPTTDPYGRSTFYAYDVTDGRLIRSIQGTVPSVTYANYAAVLAALRDPNGTPNSTSLITDKDPLRNVADAADRRVAGRGGLVQVSPIALAAALPNARTPKVKSIRDVPPTFLTHNDRAVAVSSVLAVPPPVRDNWRLTPNPGWGVVPVGSSCNVIQASDDFTGSLRGDVDRRVRVVG